ncbi:ComF family protein [Modicisalibacter radicis]|uniref:ComF family protein n=1 Tax=Halomonas sp. EAR18 TaxID=2518972 RepID=UPI001FCE3CDE|nr:ComF family protein [Halomonas sp. EAR18]
MAIDCVDRRLRRALPGRCAFCLGRCLPDAPWCRACLIALPWNRHACVQCAEPLPESAPRYCGHCLRRPPAFTVARIGLRYEDEIAALVQRFKFGHDPRAGHLLASLMSETLAGLESEQWPDMLVALPRHPQRAREQGFDPGPWLAERLAARLRLPWHQPQRLRETPSQRGLDRLARRRNLKGAFVVDGALPERVALVDDVMTTGASLDALATACRAAGAGYVEAWAVARTPLGH